MDHSKKLVTFEELQNHRSRDDCWVLIHGKVYDMSDFIQKHPGGQKFILQNAGFDGSAQYDDAYHTDEQQEQLQKFLVGNFDMETFPDREELGEDTKNG